MKYVLIAGLVLLVITIGTWNQYKLYRHCIDDGRKDYECHGYVYGGRR